MSTATTEPLKAVVESTPSKKRARLRDLNIQVGNLPTGTHNAITDVPGVRVGYTTIIREQPHVARTGVTVIIPGADGAGASGHLFAGYHSFNGNGEMTGLLWVEESGLLTTSVAITNTHQVGLVRDAIISYESERSDFAGWMLPIVAETFDGYLNDINAPNVTKEAVYQAIKSAKSGPVAEGNVGGAPA